MTGSQLTSNLQGINQSVKCDLPSGEWLQRPSPPLTFCEFQVSFQHISPVTPEMNTHTHTHMFDRQYQLQNLENVGVFFLKVYSTTGRRSSFITCQPAISSAQTTERCSWLPQTFLLCKFNDSPSIHCAEEKSYRHGFILNYIKLGLSNHPSASAGEK